MGAALVGRAIAYAADVPLQPNEYRLLVGMCLTALDTDERPRYFDSREASALYLGRRVSETGPDRAAAFQAVKVALQGLVQLEAVERLKRGGNGRRAEFGIVLDARRSELTTVCRTRTAGVRRTYPSGVGRTSQLGYVRPTDGVGRPYPSGKEEPQEGREEEHLANRTTSLAPVDNSEEAAA